MKDTEFVARVGLSAVIQIRMTLRALGGRNRVVKSILANNLGDGHRWCESK